jgi:hypothetical protein
MHILRVGAIAHVTAAPRECRRQDDEEDTDESGDGALRSEL